MEKDQLDDATQTAVAQLQADWNAASGKGWDPAELCKLYCDEAVFFGVQSKGFSKRYPVPLGMNLNDLRSDWGIITVHANSDAPICFVLSLNEVRNLASQGKNGGKWWLEPKACDRDQFPEAWHHIGIR